VSTYPVANIDLAALKHNLERVKTLTPKSRVMSVIKANAYGHGAIHVAAALSASDAFAVARLDEALQLRGSGIEQPIVLLEGVHSLSELQLAAEFDLSPVFHHQSQIELLSSCQLTTPLSFCWIMLETGMHRLGMTVEGAEDALTEMKKSHNISGQIGLMSHFANADWVDDERNSQQLMRVKQFSEQHDLSVSLANSAAVLSYVDSHADWVRPGLMLYGISPFEDKTAHELGLEPVMKLTSKVIAIQDIKQGDQVGYGGCWQAKQNTRIATVNIGYGDGYSRQLSNTASVSIKRQLARVLGRVSMDMIVIDISGLDIEIGDDVTLWGNDLLAVEQLAQQANTIPYELVCQVSDRVKRNYHNG